jgi:hypothetical protein
MTTIAEFPVVVIEEFKAVDHVLFVLKVCKYTIIFNESE